MPTLDSSLGVNLPASNINTKQVGALSFALWNSAATRYIDLEVSARYGCPVHIFDPTTRAIAHGELGVKDLRQAGQTPC